MLGITAEAQSVSWLDGVLPAGEAFFGQLRIRRQFAGNPLAVKRRQQQKSGGIIFVLS